MYLIKPGTNKNLKTFQNDFNMILLLAYLSFWPDNKILNNINVTSAGVTLVSILGFKQLYAKNYLDLQFIE